MDLRASSRTFLHLDTRHSSHRTRVLKPSWQKESDDSTDLFQSNVIERYKLRPTTHEVAEEARDGVDWNRMTLTYFASHYALMSKPPAVINEDGVSGGCKSSPHGCYLLQDGKQWVRKRNKLACIQTHGMSFEKDGQDYYVSLLMLHLPFRAESELLEQNGRRFSSPMEAFVARHGEFSFVDGTPVSNAHFQNEVALTMTQLDALDMAHDPIALQMGMRPQLDVAAAGLSDMRSRDLYQFDAADAERYRQADDDGFQWQPEDEFESTDAALNRDSWVQDGGMDAAHRIGDQLLSDSAHAAGALRGESLEDRLTVNPSSLMPNKEFEALLRSLNVQQLAIYQQVVNHARSLYQFGDGVVDTSVRPLRLFVSGGGGTGKSYLLRAIREYIMRATQNRGCMVCAPTGVAAFNVGGRTLHGALAITVDQKNQLPSGLIAPLQGIRLQEKQQLFQHVDYLIIDEISMVSDLLLSKISMRLNQLKQRDHPVIGSTAAGVAPTPAEHAEAMVQRSFGGISVIVIGDMYQLKPVRGRFAFDPQSLVGAHLWSQFTLNELTANERQANDPVWCSMLNRLRIGSKECLAADMQMLRERLTFLGMDRHRVSRPIDDTQVEWKSALRIFGTTAACAAYNSKMTVQLSHSADVYRMDAEHVLVYGTRDAYMGVTTHAVPTEWIPDKDDDCGGLTKTLQHVGVGSRIMLRRNISVVDGLVNGATGVVRSIEWLHGAAGPSKIGELPDRVMVLFDDKRVGAMQQQRALTGDTVEHAPVAITPVCSRFEGVGGSGRRTMERVQLPLILCWAATVHKVQGLTLDRVVVDLTTSTFQPAMAYVALSRVRTLSGLALSSFAPVPRICNADNRVRLEYERLRELMTVLPFMGAPRTQASKRPSAVEKRESFGVERVVGKMYEVDHSLWYQVKWKGFASKHNTWEPAHHLQGCEQLVRECEDRLRKRGLRTGVEYAIRKARSSV